MHVYAGVCVCLPEWVLYFLITAMCVCVCVISALYVYIKSRRVRLIN